MKYNIISHCNKFYLVLEKQYFSTVTKGQIITCSSRLKAAEFPTLESCQLALADIVQAMKPAEIVESGEVGNNS